MITVAGLTGVRAAIFDFNGTITDDETLQYEIYAGLCAEMLGFDLSGDSYFHDFAGRSDPEIVADLLTRAAQRDDARSGGTGAGVADGAGIAGGGSGGAGVAGGAVAVPGGGHPHPALAGWGPPSPPGGAGVAGGGSGGAGVADGRLGGAGVAGGGSGSDGVTGGGRVSGGSLLADRLLAERVRRYGAAVRDRPPVRSGTVALIRALRGRLPLAVTTGALRAEVDAILTACGLAEAFDAIVTIEDVSVGKPDPEGFLLALDLLKRRAPTTAAGSPPLEPDDVVVFEDSPYGIAAAQAAGMRCVAAHLTSEPTGFVPGAVVDTLGPELLGP